MSLRPIAGLIALSMAGAAQSASRSPTILAPDPLLFAMALLAVAGCALVLAALRERRRERPARPQPVRLRQTVRRYTQP